MSTGGRCREFISAAIDAAVAIAQGQLIQTFAGRRRILAGQARPAELIVFQADAAGNGFQRQIKQAVGDRVPSPWRLLGLGEAGCPS